MKTALIFKHVPFEGPAAIRQWLERQGLQIEQLHTPDIADWQALELPDWLVIMGGPMSVNDTSELPWLIAEKAFVKRAIDAGTKVLGICLGAQLIANVLGAAVTRNADKEIGWFPISATPAGLAHPLGQLLSAAPTVLHWHGETFAIPAAAIHLAQSEACAHQAFLFGNNALGLQCHLEMGLTQVTRLADACADELATGQRFIQPVETILSKDAPFAASQALLEKLLDTFNRL